MHGDPRFALKTAVQEVALFERLEDRCLLAGHPGGIWHINGDQGGVARNDVIVIQVDPTDSKRLQATLNGVVVGSKSRDRVGGILVRAGGGDDNVSINLGVEDESIKAT